MATCIQIFPGVKVVTFGDGRTATFKAPTDLVLGQALTSARREPLAMVDVLIDQCCTEGDKAELKDKIGYVKQLAELTDDLFGKVDASLFWGEGFAFLDFSDGTKLTLKPCTRKVYEIAQAKAKTNPLNYLKHLLTECAEVAAEADAIKNSAGHLLGFAGVADEFTDHTGAYLGN